MRCFFFLIIFALLGFPPPVQAGDIPHDVPAWHFTVNDSGRFVRSDSGAEQFLVTLECETALWTASLDELRRMDALGSDGLYISTWSGDDPGHHGTPWLDPRNKDAGFDDTRTATWRSVAEYWCSLDPRNFLIIVLMEEEHFLQSSDAYFAITWGQWLSYLDWRRETFEHLPQIVLVSEEARYSPAVLGPLCRSVQDSTIHPVAVHPPGHFYPWADSSGWEFAPWVQPGVVDVFLFQSYDPITGGFELNYWQAQARSEGLSIAMVSEELAFAGNGIPSDSDGGVVVGMEWLWRAYPSSAGVGIYSGYIDDGCTDLDCPTPEVHAELLRHAASSARAIESGGFAPATARLVYDVPVPEIVADRNGDGVVDAGDL